MTARVEYRSNNSGGYWWLTDEDWHALEDAGWVVHWADPNDDRFFSVVTDEEGKHRYMGALAVTAYKPVKDGMDPETAMRMAINQFNMVTSCNASSLGCYSCCGAPHHFTAYDHDGKYVDSWSPTAPEYGDDY